MGRGTYRDHPPVGEKHAHVVYRPVVEDGIAESRQDHCSVCQVACTDPQTSIKSALDTRSGATADLGRPSSSSRLIKGDLQDRFVQFYEFNWALISMKTNHGKGKPEIRNLQLI